MILTKTDFLAFLDAPRHLWAIKNNKLTEKEIDAFLKHLFEQGYDVEELAEQYIKEILVPKYGISLEEFLFQPTCIDGLFEARADALLFNPKTKKWDIFEIKSSNEISKQDKYDATFQYLVFKKSYDIGDINIIHLNKEYIRGNNLNILNLFVITNISEEVLNLKDDIHRLRYEALEVLKISDSKDVRACIRPKLCPCINLCHPNLPEYSIYDINNFTGNEKKVRQLEDMGAKSVYEVPSSFPLSEKQRTQVNVAQNKQIFMDLEMIERDIKGVEYPIYFIDYESFNPAIPIYKGYKPYDQIPFQWSLHVQKEKDGNLEHFEFIETQKIDPISNFLESLKPIISKEGSIIVWNKAFEGTQNKRMGEIHPTYNSFCESMNSRLYDLMDIFRDGLYADPICKGSYSIKQILPALVPELSYHDMEIGDGATAMSSWKEMVFSDIQETEKIKIKNNLLKYCELDTLAMVKIYEFLKSKLYS